MLRLYSALGKKSVTDVKLVCALERCDELEYRIEKLQSKLAEYHFLLLICNCTVYCF
jgi:hypothetical protein